MRRWLFWILLILALVAVGWYYYGHLVPQKLSTVQTTETTQTAASNQNPAPPPAITWETVERPQDGIKLQMPAGAKDSDAPAYKANGAAEQVNLVLSNTNSDTTFAIAWENDPPVAHANRHDPERTLQAARDGMLARTQTFLIQQSDLKVAGFPALDLSARNQGGGILDARLIYVNGCLYSLIVAFPDLAARRQSDVDRFYQSFTPGAPPSRRANASS